MEIRCFNSSSWKYIINRVKLLLRVKKEVKNLDKNKQIFVIHNLKDYSTEEQVNDYIENI